VSGIWNMAQALLPAWAQDGNFSRYMFTLGLAHDAILEKAVQGADASNPLETQTPTSLALSALDLLLTRGLTESDASFGKRLARALDDWALAGLDWMVLRQALGLVLAFTPMARTVKDVYTAAGSLDTSIWSTFVASADTTQSPARVFTGGATSHAANFDWDSLSPTTNWGSFRYWLILYAVSGNQWVNPAPYKWGAAGVTWGNWNPSWGTDQPPQTWSTLQSILKLWQRGGSWCRQIIVSFDATLFDPTQAVGGAVNPDGTFGRWSKVVSGQYVPARFASAVYCDGIY